jgi:hypothetical protein
MKTNPLPNLLKRVSPAVAALGLIVAIPAVQAQDPKSPQKIKIKDEEGDSKIKVKPNKVKIKGDAAREMLKPEVTSTWVKGYTVPTEYREYFTEVPAVERDNVVVRYRGGRAYYINSNDWSIVNVVDLDPSVEVTTEDSAYVEGYVIPETRRSYFVEVPTPDTGTTVRYYNNTAYYMDPSYQIVRTVPLASR